MSACLPEIRNAKKKKWLQSYEKCLNRSMACSAVRIARSTFWRWFKSDSLFAERVKEIDASIVDEIEGKLLILARDGDLRAIKMFLKAKARNRGYSDKLEISQTSKHEYIDTKRLEILLSDRRTANALEIISSKYLEEESFLDNEK